MLATLIFQTQLKTSLALFNSEIPKHLNYKKLNPEILIQDSFVKIADENIEWKGKDANDDLISGTLRSSILERKRFPIQDVLSHDDVITLYNSGSGQSYPYTQPVTISVDKSQSLKGFVVGTGSSVVSGKTGNAISLTQSSSIILKSPRVIDLDFFCPLSIY